VVDGPEIPVSLSGQVNEVKCAFAQEQLDLGQICVHKKVESFFYLKNQCRNASVFHVKALPAGVEVFPMKVKLLPDENKQFKLFILSQQENEVQTDVLR